MFKFEIYRVRFGTKATFLWVGLSIILGIFHINVNIWQFYKYHFCPLQKNAINKGEYVQFWLNYPFKTLLI